MGLLLARGPVGRGLAPIRGSGEGVGAAVRDLQMGPVNVDAHLLETLGSVVVERQEGHRLRILADERRRRSEEVGLSAELGSDGSTEGAAATAHDVTVRVRITATVSSIDRYLRSLDEEGCPDDADVDGLVHEGRVASLRTAELEPCRAVAVELEARDGLRLGA